MLKITMLMITIMTTISILALALGPEAHLTKYMDVIFTKMSEVQDVNAALHSTTNATMANVRFITQIHFHLLFGALSPTRYFYLREYS